MIDHNQSLNQSILIFSVDFFFFFSYAGLDFGPNQSINQIEIDSFSSLALSLSEPTQVFSNRSILSSFFFLSIQIQNDFGTYWDSVLKAWEIRWSRFFFFRFTYSNRDDWIRINEFSFTNTCWTVRLKLFYFHCSLRRRSKSDGDSPLSYCSSFQTLPMLDHRWMEWVKRFRYKTQ